MPHNNSAPVIAIVEDNPDNMLLARVLLQDRYQLQEYTDGRAAINGIISNPPCLVLMDISLPEIDGVTVMQRLRSETNLSGLPIVALTAHAMVGDKQRFLAAGFDYYISKPILGSSQLIEPIEQLLGRNT